MVNPTRSISASAYPVTCSTSQKTANQEIKHQGSIIEGRSTLKGPFSKGYLTMLSKVAEAPNIKMHQPSLDMHEARHKKFRAQGIKSWINGGIFSRYSQYGFKRNAGQEFPMDMVFEDLIYATMSVGKNKPMSIQYPRGYGTFNGSLVGRYGHDEQYSHLETYIVTPSKAILRAGVYGNNINDFGVLKKDFQGVSLNIYTCDISIFIPSQNRAGKYLADNIYLGDPDGFFNYTPEAIPMAIAERGACGVFGNFWTKHLCKDNGKMLEHTLTVDFPDFKEEGYFVPAPVCLGISTSSKYIKLTAAVMAEGPQATVEHKGVTYKVTTLEGLMDHGIVIKRASDGKALSKEEFKDFRKSWYELKVKADAWRADRTIDGKSYALQIKSMKEGGFEIPVEYQVQKDQEQYKELLG